MEQKANPRVYNSFNGIFIFALVLCTLVFIFVTVEPRLDGLILKLIYPASIPPSLD